MSGGARWCTVNGHRVYGGPAPSVLDGPRLLTRRDLRPLRRAEWWARVGDVGYPLAFAVAAVGVPLLILVLP